MADDTGRITVSRDALRAELATLELRLVDKLATKADLVDVERRVSNLERWRAYTGGIAAGALALSGICTALIIHAL